LKRPAVEKAAVAAALCGPLLWLSRLIYLDVRAPGSGLGPDAGEAVVHFLGEWSLITLLLAYSVSPVRRRFKVPGIMRIRRLTGLFAFAYVSMHISSYVALYLQFDWRTFLEDLVERPYITAGMAAFVCLTAMAVTSTRGWQRRLGKNWRRLHRVVHAALALALIHLWWLTKDGYGEVALFTFWFAALAVERGMALTVTRARRGAQ